MELGELAGEDGFAVGAEVLDERGESFGEAVYFLWHFPSDLSVRPAVSRHAALWRPDFPLPKSGATTRPAASPEYCRIFVRRLCTV